MKKSNILIGIIKAVFGLALAIAVLGSVYLILIAINPYWELTSDNATMGAILSRLSNLREMLFIVILPMVVVMALTFLALILITKRDADQVEFIEIKGKKEIDPEVLFAKIEEFKQKKRITPRMIMPVAVKLEKLKGSHKYKDDEEFQIRARSNLNWCYERIGQVEYEVRGVSIAEGDEAMQNEI